MHAATISCKRHTSKPGRLLLCSLLTLSVCSINILAQPPMPDDDELKAIPDYGDLNIIFSEGNWIDKTVEFKQTE